MSFRIAGTGSSAPENTVDNNMLSKFLDTSDDWIVSRTGISRRHIITEETVISMGVAAARKALHSAAVSPEQLDLIIFTTIQGDYITPSAACVLQKEIGASCPAFDINSACTGFIYALDIAEAYFWRGGVENILIVSSEGMSRFIDWTDRATCVLFGDGAGAAVLKRGGSLGAIQVGAAGDAEPLSIPGTVGESPYNPVRQAKMFLQMQGSEVFRFAVGAIVENIRQILGKAKLTLSEIDWIIPHQANIRIIKTAAKLLKIPVERFLTNIGEYANTSSASIPIMLHEALADGRIKAGQKIIMVAFGGGMTTGACVLEI